ncbi:MAG: glycosyltransferase family 39 protein [Coleofasciculus sp. C1-SOL-03]
MIHRMHYRHLIPNSTAKVLLFCLLILLTLGVFLRFANLDRKAYWYDETRTSIRAIAAYMPTSPEAVFDNRITGIEDIKKYQEADPQRSITDSLYVMAKDDPKHSPLYYILVGIWGRIVGDSVGTVRALSAIISLLGFPCIYWLAIELFGSNLTAGTATALMAVSPVFVLYAQEARPYTLWTVTILLSSVTLLRAIRLNNRASWVIYALSIALGIYTHILFNLVILSHAIYVLIIGYPAVANIFAKKENTRKIWLPQVWINYLLSTFLGLITFTPWAKFIWDHRDNFRMSYLTEQKGSLSFFIKSWVLEISALFLDYKGSSFIDLSQGKDNKFHYLVYLPILILIVYSIYYLIRRTPKQIWLFICTLIVVPILALTLPDLISEGIRSTVVRYFFPSYLAIQLAVAYLLSSKCFTANVSHQKLWQLITVVLISAGVVSCAISLPAKTWWSKSYSYYNAQVAEIINQANNPRLVVNYSWYNSTQLLSMSHILEPKVKLQLLAEPEVEQISLNFSPEQDIFLYNPSKDFQKDINQAGFELKNIHERGQLWQLKK